jgi:phage terminase large subunit-like protein
MEYDNRFLLPDSHYDKARADRVVNFIAKLCHTKSGWTGKPFYLLDWQEKLVRTVFGVVRPNGRRQFKTVFCEVSKKNGKSELAAAVALYMLCSDGEQAAEVYGAACDKRQAGICFDVAVNMIAKWPALSRRLKLYKSQKELLYQPTRSAYRVLSSDVASKHGYSPSAIIFDELHAQPNRRLWDVLTKGTGAARPQQLILAITTAGTDRTSICYELHEKACGIIQGTINDPTFYPVIYAAEENDDWADEAVWRKANPSLGITFEMDDLREAYNSAKQNAAEENSFRQFRLNQWVSDTTRWLSTKAWDESTAPIDMDRLRGQKCYCGVDLSSTTDITALVLIFPPSEEDGIYSILPFFWLPADTIPLRVRRDHVPYDLWKRQGLLETTPGNVIDYSFIRKRIEELSEVYQITEIAADPWQATQLMQNLQDEGFTVFPMRQGMKTLAPCMKELERLTLEKKLAHGGNPVLRWMLDNLRVKMDENGNVRPVKDRRGEKIDGIIALMMGLYRAVLGNEPETEYIYADRELTIW